MGLSDYQTLNEHFKDPVAFLYALSECREPFLKALQKYEKGNSQSNLVQTVGLVSDLIGHQEEFLSRIPEEYREKARHLLSKSFYETVDYLAQSAKMYFENKPNWEILSYLLGKAVKAKITSSLRR